MAVVIRLQRHGAKKKPYYRIIAINSREAVGSGNVLEVLGKYDPMQPKDSDKRVIFDADKIKSWMAKGAKPSDRVYRFLANAGIVVKREIPNQTKKNQPSEATLAKLKAREEKLIKAKEAAAAPIPEASVEEPAVEAPAKKSTQDPVTASEASTETSAIETATEAQAETSDKADSDVPSDNPATEATVETSVEESKPVE